MRVYDNLRKERNMFKNLKLLLKGLSRKNMKAWPKCLKYYLLGVGSALVLGMILEHLEPLPTREQAAILEQWKIHESDEGLIISFVDVQGTFWEVLIERNSSEDSVEKLYFVKNEKDIVFSYLGFGDSNIFGYDTGYGYNSPLVKYGWFSDDDSDCVWKDLNFDSRFDERYISGKYEILVEDSWEQGKKDVDNNKLVHITSGIYEFDVDLGKWLKTRDEE